MRNTKLSKLWDALHSSYWFLPSIMVIAAIALIATHTRNPKYQAVLRSQAEMIQRGACEALPEQQDHENIKRYYSNAV
jgi:uncharacterized membrane protein